MNTNLPLVSICIPTFNNENYIKKCLDSIVNQTYSNIEVIINDNFSTDETWGIVQKYSNLNNWTCCRNKENIGAFENFNKLISKAKGDYISIYHSDDIYDQKIVEKCAEVLNKNINIKLVGTMAKIIDISGIQIGQYNLPSMKHGMNNMILNFENVMETFLYCQKKNELETDQLFITPSIMVRSEIYDTLGLFNSDKKFGSSGDYEMWLRVSLNHNISIIDEKLMSYRVHPDQGSNREIINNINIPDIISVLKEYVLHVSNIRVRNGIRYLINKILIGTAIKQNKLKIYSLSTLTLKNVNHPFFFPLKAIILTMNLLKIKFN
jgi:glycosyltransferase involved in cell wall biosynthesis